MKDSILSVQNLNLKVGLDNQLLKNANFSIQKGDIAGLVGQNGAGKSTLLKVIAGGNQAFIKEGNIQVKGLVYYLPQLSEDYLDSNLKVYEYVSNSQVEWWESLISIKKEFGIDLDELSLLKNLSGGEKVLLDFCIGLSLSPSLFLLDEPTNHLDSYSKGCILKLIKSINSSFVIVSHDKSFLQDAVSSVLKINNKNIISFDGNYKEFIEWEEEQKLAKVRKYEALEKEIKKKKRQHLDKVEKLNRNANKSNRESTSKGFSDFFNNRSEKNRGRISKSFQKSQQELENKASKLKESRIKSAYLPLDSESKDKFLLLNIEDCQISINKKVLVDNLNLKIYYGDRVHIAGRNGSGKTTLIKNILNKKLSGLEYLKENAKIVYLDQKYELVDRKKSVIKNVQTDSSKGYKEIRKALGNMLFRNDSEINKKAKHLSGGEIARLAFAKISLQSIDLLILDEPTNNLDIQTKEVIVESLKDFKGAIILISHDEWFVSEITDRHISLSED